MDSSPYKECHRQDMIKWGEEIRDKDPTYFCRKAAEGVAKPIWLVSDCRRTTDVEYFTARYPCLSVQVIASETVRRERGWSFVPGVDDAESECGLDQYNCDVTLCNDDDSKLELEQVKHRILKHLL